MNVFNSTGKQQFLVKMILKAILKKVEKTSYMVLKYFSRLFTLYVGDVSKRQL